MPCGILRKPCGLMISVIMPHGIFCRPRGMMDHAAIGCIATASRANSCAARCIRLNITLYNSQ